MPNERVTYIPTDQPELQVTEPGASRQILAHNEQLMIVRNYFVKGWTGTRHEHPHEQAVYVLKGKIRFETEGKAVELSHGDSVVVAGNTLHQAMALEDSEVLDVFTPRRQDFLS